jgi:hypothetical protein
VTGAIDFLDREVRLRVTMFEHSLVMSLTESPLLGPAFAALD